MTSIKWFSGRWDRLHQPRPYAPTLLGVALKLTKDANGLIDLRRRGPRSGNWTRDTIALQILPWSRVIQYRQGLSSQQYDPTKSTKGKKGGKKMVKRADPRLLTGDATSPVNPVSRTSIPRSNYRFKETFGISGLVITSSTTVTQYGGLQFTFADLPSAGSFSAVFDRYRILGAKVMFKPYGQQMSTGVGTVGQLHTAVDFDDASTPSSIGAIERYGTYAGVPGNRSLQRHFAPRVAGIVYRGVATTGFSEVPYGGWMDMAYTDVPYYGLKYALETTASTAQFVYQVFVTLDVEVAARR